MSKIKWGRHLWQLLVAVIPVPITIWLTVLCVQDRSGVRNLEYTRSVREGLVNLPKSLPSKLQLTYDGKPVENLSSVTYQIFNRTGKSFQEVKIFFEIGSLDGAPAELLSKTIEGPKGYPRDGFQELTPKMSSIGWQVETVNPSDSLLDAFEVTFLFPGPKAPKVDLSALKSGLGFARAYPLPAGPRPRLAGGFWSQTEPTQVEQAHLVIEAYPVGVRGQIGVRVRTSRKLWERDRPESQDQATVEILSTYNRLQRFALDLDALVSGAASEALLEVETLT